MSQTETPQESPVPGAVASRRAPALRGREPCAPRPLCGLCSRTHGLVSDVATEPPRPRAVWGGRRTLQGGSLTACYVPLSGLGRFAARPVGEVARPGRSWRSRGPARGRGGRGGPGPEVLTCPLQGKGGLGRVKDQRTRCQPRSSRAGAPTALQHPLPTCPSAPHPGPPPRSPRPCPGSSLRRLGSVAGGLGGGRGCHVPPRTRASGHGHKELRPLGSPGWNPGHHPTGPRGATQPPPLSRDSEEPRER